MRQLWTITAFDLRQRVRDKSVLIFGLVVPLAMMGVFNLLFSGLEEGTELEPVTVAASVPADDRMAGALVDVLGQVAGMEVTVRQVAADEVRDLAAAGEADLGVVVPAGFTAQVTSGRAATVRLVEGDGAGLETDILVSVVHGVVDRLTAGVVAATAGAMSGLPPQQLAEIGRQVAAAGPQIMLAEGAASDEQLPLKAAMVAGQAGLFLMFTVGFGVLALLAEREQGTLPRLQSMPMRPGTVVAAKALTGYVLGVVATSMLLTLGSLLFGATFGSIAPIAVLVLCAVAAATSLTFVVARLARTAEQANVIQSILAVVLGMAGGAFFPIQATGVVAFLLDLNPVAALVRGLGITSGGGGLGDIGPPVLIMVGFALTCLLVSRLVPDRASAV